MISFRGYWGRIDSEPVQICRKKSSLFKGPVSSKVNRRRMNDGVVALPPLERLLHKIKHQAGSQLY